MASKSDSKQVVRAARQERLRAALRANLRRRKTAQARAQSRVRARVHPPKPAPQ